MQVGAVSFLLLSSCVYMISDPVSPQLPSAWLAIVIRVGIEIPLITHVPASVLCIPSGLST